MKNYYVIEQFNELPQVVKQLFFDNIDIINKNILGHIIFYNGICESPIESLLGAAIAIQTDTTLYMQPQQTIKHKSKNYRVDFAIENNPPFNCYLKKDFKLAIECDGYDFHQKTKKQVDYDNQREYDLKMEGYETLRFSGTEIYNNPIDCANKILDFIKSKNGRY